MIEIKFIKEENRVAAFDGDKEIGECTFYKSTGIWIVDHTRVDDSYRGQKIARRLVDELAKNARLEGVKMDATCSYILSLFNEKDDYRDVFIG